MIYNMFRYYRYGMIDNLTVTRDGNQLKKVTDQCEELTYASAMDFKDGANEQVEYTWDANGNMTSDLNKGLTEIQYNILNLPEKITHSDGHITYITYAADGRKLRVTYKIAPTATCIMAMINPLESLHCEKGDTLYLRLSYDGTFFINAWNSDISQGVSYSTFWEKNKPLKLEENIWTNSYPIQYNGLDKLILNWDVVGLIEESKFVNKHFPSNHSPSTISLFRIILKEKSSYTVDFVRYLNYMPLTEEIIEDYKQEFEPFLEIPSQYIH